MLDVKKTEFDKLLEILHNPYELYKKTETPDGKTRLLKLIFERIYVYDKKIQKVQYTASIKQLLDNQAVLFRSKWLPWNSFLRTIIHTRKSKISMVLKYTFARSWHDEIVSIKRELNAIEKV